MKFANYRFNAKGVNNLGDNMQIIAIDEIYRSMGVNLEDVVYISTDQLDTYDGEYVVLPVTMPLVDYREKGVAGRFSQRIIPVFLGFTMVKETLEPEEIAYFRRFEPIGCRDERTLNTLRRYQINSYLHGCITVTLPSRISLPENGKVFLVDVDPELMKLIPEEIRRNAEIRTHLIETPLADPKSAALAQYQEYREKAGLVITSLLHCSVPCIAAGIPVVLLKTKVSYRMAWLEKILPVYTPDRVAEINWTPVPALTDEQKKRVFDFTVERLRRAYADNAAALDLSYFYEDRPKSIYTNDACDSLKRFVDAMWTDKGGGYRYSIWGMTQIAEWIVDYIAARYPNAQLCHVYDTFRSATFKGLQSESPEMIRSFPEETVFVTTNGAEKAARALFEEIHKQDGTYAFVKLIR